MAAGVVSSKLTLEKTAVCGSSGHPDCKVTGHGRNRELFCQNQKSERVWHWVKGYGENLLPRGALPAQGRIKVRDREPRGSAKTPG